VLLQLSKPVPKQQFFAKPNRNRSFMPLYWRFDFEMEQLWCLERYSRMQPASRLAHSSRWRVLSLGSKVRSPAALHPACVN